MSEKKLSEKQIREYEEYLRREEKSPATIAKYLRDVRAFALFAGGEPVTKERVIAYKQHLQEHRYQVGSVNSMLASLNSLFRFLDWTDCKVKNIRRQKPAYCAEEKELTKAEYLRLLEAAKKDPRLYLLLQTICGTGIRVSEVKYFTVEEVRRGEITIQCKNKTRTILIPGKLQGRLLRYAREQRIEKGTIFLGSTGKPLDRSRIWQLMKALCGKAGVAAGKVFPHNLRKLFARCFYELEKDIAKLADVLGHSSIDTTRIYIMTTGREHRRQIERLSLVI